MKRSIRVRLHDMLEAIDGIERSVSGLAFADYENSRLHRRAVERGVEIVSEASRHIPDDLKQRHPEIYWREIAAVGNLLRHEYGRFDDHIMWRLVTTHLPDLRSVVLDLLEGPDQKRPSR